MAKDLENQILYSIDIGDKDSSVISEDFTRSNTGSKQDATKSEKLLCGIHEKKMLTMMRIFDCLTLIRIPSVLMSILNTRGMRCYYKYRVVTFFFFLVAWLTLFVLFCLQSIDDEVNGGVVIVFGLAGGTFLFFDYYFNKFLRRHLLRLIRREQISMSKIKGRMLQ